MSFESFDCHGTVTERDELRLCPSDLLPQCGEDDMIDPELTCSKANKLDHLAKAAKARSARCPG